VAPERTASLLWHLRELLQMCSWDSHSSRVCSSSATSS
jgi:hypothetical protein